MADMQESEIVGMNTPYDIYNYICENDMQFDMLQTIMSHKNNYSIAEITDKEFLINDGVKLQSKSYSLDIEVHDDDIITAVMNKLYVSAFISRQEESYQIHFLVHKYPVSMKAQFDEEILLEVLQYMIMKTIVALRLDTPQKVDDYLNKSK